MQRWQLFSKLLLNLDIIRTLKSEFPSLAQHGADNHDCLTPIGVENEMTDNNENNTCFMCEVVGECTLIPASNVHLCAPCVIDLEEIRELD